MSAVGVDVGGTKLLAVGIDGEEVTVDPVQPSPHDGPHLVTQIAEAAKRLCDGEPDAIGIGIPGIPDAQGVVRFAPNLQGLVGTPVVELLHEHFPGTTVWIGNDATAACWGEHFMGAGRRAGEMVMVTLGTGIGGGIVSNGLLDEGGHRGAGEFGHMVVDPNGPKCPCGKRGCWERFASGSGLGAIAREMAVAGEAPRLVELAGGDREAVKGEHVTAAAAEGDPAALEIMSRFAWWVALGLSNIANALDPEVIVVGGGLIEAGDVLLEPTRKAFGDLIVAASVRRDLRIEAASLGPQAGAIGAGLLAAGH